MSFNKNYSWASAPEIIESDRKLFSHILDLKKTKKASQSQNAFHQVNFVRMETPAQYNICAPQVVKRTGKGFEDTNDKISESLKMEGAYDEKDLEELEVLRKKVDMILEYWKVRPDLFWSSDIQTVDEVQRLNLSREEADKLDRELNKVRTIEKAIDEGTFDELYDVIQEEERLDSRHQRDHQRRKMSKKILAEKFNLEEQEVKEVNEVLADQEKQMMSDDVPSTASWRPEPHDSVIDSYIYSRQKGILAKKSKLDWVKWSPYLGILVTIAYFILLMKENWWENFLKTRTNQATVDGIFHYSSDNFLPYYYQQFIDPMLQGIQISLVVVSFLPVLSISYPQQTIHSLCFYAYWLEFSRSFWEAFQWTFSWFTKTGGGDGRLEIVRMIFGFLFRYLLLVCLIKFHYEMMKPSSRLRERANRIEWRHNEEIWFKGYSDLRMRMMAMRWMQNYSRYHHWSKVKAGEPEGDRAVWTYTEEFVRRLEEPGLELADIFKFFRKELRFQWMKVPGGWEDLEIYQSDPSISTDSDMWIRGPQAIRDSRKRTKRRHYRRKYRGYGGHYADKSYTKKRRYRQREKGLKALLNRHGPQCRFPDEEEINKRLYWFRERMLIAFKIGVYQKGGGVYGGEGFSYGCLGPLENDIEEHKWKVKKENAKYRLIHNDG